LRNGTSSRPYKEPFIPGTAFNGLTDLGRDIIAPFMTRMTNAGNRPILKISPDTGHFIHTDNPVEYPVDVVDFVTKGTIDTSSPLAIDRMIGGLSYRHSRWRRRHQAPRPRPA
jgi:hypothetical protein